jgi:iron complex outermembrane receptor protein
MPRCAKTLTVVDHSSEGISYHQFAQKNSLGRHRMSSKNIGLLRRLALLASPALLLTASAVYAQDVIESESITSDAVESSQESEAEDSVEEIVVTGSRLKRTTFSSIAPLQIINAGISREAGLVNAADILQSSTSAGGQQVDLTFSGFVLDNGPGSRPLSLRGLGASRTLVLINGRRMAPGGAEGAPYAPDVGSVPAGLVQRYETLTDGASSVYGSDAIGGVANIILKKDFDGFTVEGGATSPKYDGGDNINLNVTWGKNWDRGLIGAGLDYNKDSHATYGSRPWMSECNKNYEIDTDGNYRSTDLYYAATYGMKPSDCVASGLARRVFVPGMATGSIYYTPGQSNGGWGNFSEPVSPYGGFGIDSDGDGLADASYADYSLNGTDYAQSGYLYPDYQSATGMVFGEYTFEGDANITAYFETLYTEVEFETLGSPPQLFPDVPANNPYNLCNPNAENGVDCGLAEDALFTNPAYTASFGAYYEGLCASYGIPLAGCTPATFGLLNGPIGAVGTLPIVSVKNDRSAGEGDRQQLRFVAGLTGDLPFLEMGSLTNWSFDTYLSYSKSSGASHRFGIRGDRLDLALGNYSSTDTPCENDSGVVLADDAAPGCVAVNMFAPSLYPDDIVGEFATAAETNYLFDSRDFDTDYEQTIFSASMAGDLYEMANGPILGTVGVEYRKDEINSMPDAVARDGLFFGYFSDGGAVGAKDMKEVFVEIEAPLLANMPMAKELTVNLSARITDDEIYGSNTTESFKMGWRPVNSLLIRGTYGTAFRAPNLRELFLANQTGFNTIGDPCMAPEEAIDLFTGEYNGANDPRDSQILANCAANGVDPTVARGFGAYSVEQSTGGSLTLDPETSESWTAGFSWEQEFSNDFDFGISSTYYEVDITDTIIEPNGQYIVNDCYGSRTGTSAFCSRITRDFSDPTDPQIVLLDNGFLNRDNEKARGVDVNVTFADTWTFFERPYEVSFDIDANRSIERSFLFVDDNGVEDYDDLAGEWGFPSWKGNSTLRVEYDKWRLQLRSNYIGSVDQDSRDIDPFSDINDSNGTGTFSDTCLGGPDDLLCRDVGFAKSYLIHSLSLSFVEDNWGVTVGASNILDKAPPKVDGSEVSAKNNAAIGYGYNMIGRTVYMNFAYEF